MKTKIQVLVCCERSGIVSKAFRDRGAMAFSNDIEECDTIAGRDWHIPGDCFDVIRHEGPWDLIIMHPPCTALSVSGNRHYGTGKPKHSERIKALQWTKELWCAALIHAPYVAMENPVGVLNTGSAVLPRPEYVQPYQFGHMESKKTGLWLHNLPPLQPTNDVYKAMMALPIAERQRIWYMSPSKERARLRSETYLGIADAMAEQWLNYIRPQRAIS